MSSPIKNVVFDWSGTLVDDFPAVLTSVNLCLDRLGRPPFSADEFRSRFELPADRFFRAHFSDAPADELRAWFFKSYAAELPRVVEFPHASPFLEFCQSQGLAVQLLTAVPEPLYRIHGHLRHLQRWFPEPLLGARDKRAVLRDWMRKAGWQPEETVVIGDMQHDIEAALEVAARGVGVLTGYQAADQLRQAGASLLALDLADLQRRWSELMAPLPTAHASAAVPSSNRRPIATVGALIFDDQGRVLLVQTRKWSRRWGIPGGKIEWNESSETALRRELLEETGLEVDAIQFVCVQDCIEPPEFYRSAHFLLLNYTCRARAGARVVLNDEAETFQWLPLESAGDLNLNIPTRYLLEQVLAQPRFIPTSNHSNPSTCRPCAT